MKTTRVTVLAVVGGLVAGLVLSEIIGIIGMLVFGTAAGIKFLPVYLALACAIAAPVLYRRFRHRSNQR
jgi:predicted lipid-binding transport protein (Tim44 family)